MAEIKFPTIRIDEDDMDRLEKIVDIFHLAVSKVEPCTWTRNNTVDWLEDNYWSTSCGQEFALADGTPKANGYNFCPSCGKPLVEFYIQDSEDD